MTDAKPVFTKLTASTTKDQKLRNLTAALEKSGFRVLPGRRPRQIAGSKPTTIIPTG
jgi:hypothetical protein